jgi:adenosylmethionine-8-amino-7-oxononanoate aminotransferase
LGVTSCSEKVEKVFQDSSSSKTFYHGHSYTGNPLACAAANASFSLLTNQDCQDRIHLISSRFINFVASIKKNISVKSVQSLGTILSIEMVTPENTAYQNPLRKEIYNYFLTKNILLRPLGNIIYVVPPYTISNLELDEVLSEIEMFIRSRA